MTVAEMTGAGAPERSLDQRTAFLEIGEADKAALRAFLPVLEEHVETVLDGFYAHVVKVPALKALFRDAAHIEAARSAQKRHWLQNVFAGRFDGGYLRSVTAVGRAHAKVGLEPRWYMAGYRFATSALQDLVLDTHGDDAAQAKQVLAAINKAAFLDLDLAVSVYLDAAREQTSELLGAHADKFETNVKQVVTSVSQTATELESTAGQVAEAAEESVRQSGQVSVAAEQCQAALQQIRAKVTESTEITQRAVELAGTAEASIGTLNSSADAISAFSKTISDIAGQTNLLALNATIEAARAGDAGRGFAVVASEVKALAQQTSAATEEIASRLETIQREVRATTGSINDVAETINRIDGMSQEISSEMGEQEAAMQEVASNVSGIQGAASDTGQASSETLNATSDLARQLDMLGQRADAFLREVRAAS